ncbi:MAG: Rrf2 family transcriptional regulator [candidate division KSB1 bacterium]|nr:Rrf2 family transcriptional regulator [candidate division KSB1 bacterium]MDZ7335430.1 Rrf2 family transcriptional regulator [candidate division KSB1 bacterium]MDZ7358750.1 Rrf2 family transcriptional regulator [candidate division KSB1 bacterium]MDZ7400267.1 Rrf2 family transcriptional regulator [candidate division KSB1 bacterium]
MLFSHACQYAMQAVLYLARQQSDSYVSIKEIAEKNNISFHFLVKILQKLTQQGILISYKGPKGGVSLAKPADQITPLEIVDAIDGLSFCNMCILGMPGCDEHHPCDLHHKWSRIREEIYEMLSEKSIAELID